MRNDYAPSISVHIGLHATDDGALAEGVEAAVSEDLLPVDLLTHAEPSQRPLTEQIHAWRTSQSHHSGGHGIRHRRLVVSAPALLGSRRSILTAKTLGQTFCKSLTHFLAEIEPEKPVIFLALKNPATYLDRISDGGNLLQEARFQPNGLAWLPSISEIIEACSGFRFVIWCNEDLPFVYPEVLSLLLGHPVPNRVFYDNPILRRVLNDTGRDALRQCVSGDGMPSFGAWKDSLSEIMMSHCRVRAINASVSIGLSQWGVDRVSEMYDYDVLQLAENENVTFIYP